MRRKRTVVLMTAPMLLMIGGLYFIVLVLAPMLQPIKDPLVAEGQDTIAYSAINGDEVAYSDSQLIIPKIGVNVSFLTGSSKVMEKGAWHRFPERGDPENGGNFIVSAHRFNLGWTPQQTRAKSPFYNIDKLNEGDTIIVDYKNKRYVYEVARRYSVKPDAIAIEDNSMDAKLTLYSCTKKGAQDGREVIEAKLSTIQDKTVALNIDY